jgi:hypothetical protein
MNRLQLRHTIFCNWWCWVSETECFPILVYVILATNLRNAFEESLLSDHWLQVRWAYTFAPKLSGCSYLTVDGDWGAWSPWSNCSTTCADGVITRIRSCDHPQPRFGGLNCFGNITEYQVCTNPMCRGTLCSWLYQCLLYMHHLGCINFTALTVYQSNAKLLPRWHFWRTFCIRLGAVDVCAWTVRSHTAFHVRLDVMRNDHYVTTSYCFSVFQLCLLWVEPGGWTLLTYVDIW